MKNKTELFINQEKNRGMLLEMINMCSEILLIQLSKTSDPSAEPLVNCLVERLENCPAEDSSSTKQAVDLIVNALELIWPSIEDTAKTGVNPREVAQYFTNQCTRFIYEQAGIPLPPTQTENTPLFKSASATSAGLEDTKPLHQDVEMSATLGAIKERMNMDIDQILSIIGINIQKLLSYNVFEMNDLPTEATDELSDYLLRQMDINIDDLEVPLTEKMYQQIFPLDQSETKTSTPTTHLENVQPLIAILKAYQCSLDELLNKMNIDMQHLLLRNRWSEDQILEFIMAYSNEQKLNRTLTHEKFLERYGIIEKLLIAVSPDFATAHNTSMNKKSSQEAVRVEHVDRPLNDTTPTAQVSRQQQADQFPSQQETTRSLQQALQEQQTTLVELLKKNQITIDELLTQNNWSAEQIHSFDEKFADEFMSDENLTYEAFIKKHHILEKLIIKSSALEASQSLNDQNAAIKNADDKHPPEIVSYSMKELKKILKNDFNEILVLLNLQLDDVLKHNNISLHNDLDDIDLNDFKSLSAESQLSYLYEVDPDDCMIPVPTSLLSSQQLQSLLSLQPSQPLQPPRFIATITCSPLTKADAPHIAGEYLYSFLASASYSNNQIKHPCGMLIGKANARKLDEITALNISLFITAPSCERIKIKIFSRLLKELDTLKEGLPNLKQITWYVTEKAEKIAECFGFNNSQTITHGKGTIRLLFAQISEKDELNMIKNPNAVGRSSTKTPSSTTFGFFDTHYATNSKESIVNTKPKTR